MLFLCEKFMIVLYQSVHIIKDNRLILSPDLVTLTFLFHYNSSFSFRFRIMPMKPTKPWLCAIILKGFCYK